MKCKSFLIHTDNRRAVEKLSNEQAGRLLKMILRYADDGNWAELDDVAVAVIAEIFKAQIDREKVKYDEKCEKNRQNALRRKSLIPSTATDSDRQRPIATDSDRQRPIATDGYSNSNSNSNSDSDSTNKNSKKESDTEEVTVLTREDVSFEEVFKMYGKNIGNAEKDKARRLWRALNDDERSEIFTYVPAYVLSTPDLRYRKHFSNFLDEKCWLNKINTNQSYGKNIQNNIGRREAAENSARQAMLFIEQGS